MKPIRLLLEILGRWGLVVVVLAPLVAGGVTFALAPRFIESSQGASATVDIYPVSGTHAAYEVSSSAADFGVAFKSATAAEAAARAGDIGIAESRAFLGSTRDGDSSRVHVTYQATSSQRAEEGLRAAALVALTSLADSDRKRADISARAAEKELAAAVRALGDPMPAGVSTQVERGGWIKYRSDRVSAATTAVAAAELSLQTADAVRAYVPSLVRETRVSTAPISTTSSVMRIVLAAALSSFILALVAVLLLRRFLTQRTRVRVHPTGKEGPHGTAGATDAAERSSGATCA